MAVPILTPYVAQHRACEERTRALTGDASFDRAFRGGVALSVGEAVDAALGQVAGQVAARPSRTRATSSTALSRRELEIARLVAEGLTNREIASRLFISSRTVDTHVTNMLNKLGIGSRTQLARWVE